MLQFAARALRRVHLDWQTFSLGHAGSKLEQIRSLNVGRGAEVALETAVAAAFAQEFNSSKVPHGWLTPDGDGPRFFVVDREVPFREKAADADKRIDAIIRRVTNDGEKDNCGITPIEMKRARRFIADIGTGKAEPARAHGVLDVKKDVAKLIAFSQRWKAGGFTADLCAYVQNRLIPDVFPHVLVWGVDEGADVDAKPKSFLDEVGGLGNASVEWFPLAWSPRLLEDGPPADAVTRWMWIAYAEVTVP